MFVFLPYATHELTYRRPWANYALLFVTCAAFFAFGGMDRFALARSVHGYALGGESPLGPITYLFIHVDLGHLIGNMLALWLFGNAICARVGNAAYPPLYLALGALAGLAQMVSHDGYTVGASAAINGLVGMFLVINPRARMSILVGWLLPPVFRTWNLRSYWFIAVWMIWDIIGAATGSDEIAYGAHLAGYLLGVGVALAALRLRLVPLDDAERTLPDLLGWGWRGLAPPRRQSTRAAVEASDAVVRRATRTAPPQAPDRRSTVPPRPVVHRPIAPPDGLRRDPQFTTLICACGERVEASRLFGLDGLRCPRCQAPLAPAPNEVEPHRS
ncbi:MAG: hypothetical protein CVU56_12650 [Deltaproteobacteria bacterium HGW-Deltaproteobacteria-14]|jgi:membrane associated rhomboid family serine protease|nr:MAG: hypothetical protein CVU56_12650 [Deltaproteobacteria bacterium HGW-Deltaproteobacteria-14]